METEEAPDQSLELHVSQAELERPTTIDPGLRRKCRAYCALRS